MNLRFLITCLLLASCSTTSPDTDDEDENMIKIAEDDPRLLRAIKATQDSLPYYIDYFQRFHENDNFHFFVKGPIYDDTNEEHMWLSPIRLEAESFLCVLDNDPNVITNHRYGDTISIQWKDIEDCMIVTPDTTVIGNYLQKELRK